MNKFLIYFLSTIVVLLSAIIALRFFVFSESGNTTIKTYLQSSLKEAWNTPLKIYNFSLDEEKMKFSVNINEQVHINVITQYNMFTQYFAGIYYLQAEKFEHKGFHLKDANVSGRFKGRRGNMQIQGQGTILDANTVYRFHLKNSNFKHIEAKIKGLNSADIFAMLGEKPLFRGNMDLDMYLPQLGKESAKGHGNIVLEKALFDSKGIQEEYGIDVAPKSYVLGTLDMQLEGQILTFSSHSKSNLFSIDIEKGSFDVENKSLVASYSVDTDMLSVFTKNTLIGAFKVAGDIALDKETYHIKGESTSWGGYLGFDISESSSIRLHKIHLNKVLYALKQVPFAQGLLTANIQHQQNKQSEQKGTYTLRVDEGNFDALSIDEAWGYEVPRVNTFALTSHGLISDEMISVNTSLNSTLGDIALSHANYNISKRILDTEYKVFVPNIALLLRENTAVKKGYMSAKGKASFGEVFKLSGKIKGLGGMVNFVSGKQSTTIEASEILLEKVLSLLSASRYMRGKINSSIILNDVTNLDGNFSLSSEKIWTQPRMMETLIGETIALPMRLESKGQIKEGNLSLFIHLDSDILALNFDNMEIDKKTKSVKTSYMLNIPELQDIQILSKKKLYGAMTLLGTLSYDKILKVQGYTNALGGEIAYEILDKGLETHIDKVSVKNIFLFLGFKSFFDGIVSGNIYYGLESKEGLLRGKIDDFHLKITKMSNAIQGIIGKDPSSIIYSDNTFDAEINGDITAYTLTAIGKHSSIKIEEGIIDTLSDTQSGNFVFRYNKFEIKGKITGTSSQAKFSLNISQ